MSEQEGFQVYWAALMERSVPQTGCNALMKVAAVAGAHGCTQISIPYMRTDWARNLICRAFLDGTKDENDLLIMMDCDHDHPRNIVPALASHPAEMGMVGALSFRRGPPYEAMFFHRDAAGFLRSPAEWEKGVYECEAVGFAAVAIRRWVFDALDKTSHGWPYFRFIYPPENGFNKSEDIYFCELVQQAGIQIYCNTSLVSPHLGEYLIDDTLWFEQNKDKVQVVEMGRENVPTIQTRVNV